MTAKKKDDAQPPPPAVRVAPLGELKAYTISETELNALAEGSTGSLFLNIALALLPVSMTIVITLLTTTITSDRVFQAFVIVASVSFISGLVLLLLWWRTYKSPKRLAEEIRNRMPPPPGIQETVPAPEQAIGAKTSAQAEKAEAPPPATGEPEKKGP